MEIWKDDLSYITYEYSMEGGKFDSEQKLPDDAKIKRQYLENIARFHSIVQGKHPVDLKHSASELNLKVKNHSEFDCGIQATRITNILARAIEKCRLALILPQLMKNDGYLLKKFGVEDVSESMIEYSLRKSVEARMTTITGQPLNRNLNSTIETLITNKKLLKCSKRMTLTSFEQQLLDALSKLKEVMEKKMKVSAAEERDKKIQCVNSYRIIKEIKAKIEKIQEGLDHQRNEYAPKFAENDREAEIYKYKMDLARGKTKETILKRVIQSEERMVNYSEQSSVQQIELAINAKLEADKYDKMLEEHIISEKLLRASKFKVESQLANWLNKYDTDIGERQEQFELLQTLYEQDASSIADLRIIFDEQECIYNEYIMEKTEEDEQELYRKYKIIKRSWAARRIQRFWRVYRARKIAKKKAKKAKAAAKAAAKGKK